MMRVVVYGNCQAGPIGRLIERAAPQLDVVRAPPVHTIVENQIVEIEELFRTADIVLSQPIGSHFGRLSSDALKALPGRREWITYPPIYFGGLFPYLHYLRKTDGSPLKGPLSDYHDLRIVKAFLSGAGHKACEELLSAQDPAYCHKHFANAVQESRRREDILPIRIMDYVMKGIASERPFHTFNHPTNAVLWHVVTQFLDIIGQPILTSDGPPVNQFLNEISAAIPPEISSIAGLDYVDCYYKVKGEQIEWSTLIFHYYEIYNSTVEFAELCARNGVT